MLSGQSPEVILDVCSRAISFWSYQMHQERVYVEMTTKGMQEKWSSSERYYQNSIVQLKSDISSLSDKYSDLGKQLEVQKRREAEALEQVVEKTRQLKKLQSLCDKLRRKETFARENGTAEFEAENICDFMQLPSIAVANPSKPSWLDKWNHQPGHTPPFLQTTPNSQANFGRKGSCNKNK